MKILVVGGGGREHALCWAVARSPLCGKLYCAPGNAGIADVAECLPVKAEDVDGILAAVDQHAIDFVIVGPEAALVAGLADRVRGKGQKKDVKCFGPNQDAAELEGSKAFMKQLCQDQGIPTARYGSFSEAGPAKEFANELGPCVVKADGLAAGKGVIMCDTAAAAHRAIDEMMTDRAFGAAGETVLVEEFMAGTEISVFYLADGRNYRFLASAQDHKRAFDRDQGPNTGGMGAFSPSPLMTPALKQQIEAEIIAPTVEGMTARGAPYQGVLYAGLMLTAEGPKLLEYNVRFGDPECQVMMARLTSDLVPVLLATDDPEQQTLPEVALDWRQEHCLTVVMAAKGYPGSYEKGTEIRGLDQANAQDDVVVFHAGTQAEGGRVLSNGGRVLNVTAWGDSLEEARDKAYGAVEAIDWPQGFYRTDIAMTEGRNSSAATPKVAKKA